MRGISGLFTRGRVIVAVVVAVAAVAVGGTALALTTSASSHVVSMSTSGRTSAALKITTGTPVLQVSVGNLGGTLLRVSTPDDAPVRAVLSGSKLIVLSLTGAAQGSGSQGSGSQGSGYAVKVVLNSAVTWSLDLAGGTQRTMADLRGGKVGGIAVTAGTDVLDVSLPKPAGTFPFLLAGGASQFLLSLPGGVPAQVTVGAGRVLRVGRRPEPDRGRGRDGADPARLGHRYVPVLHRRNLRVLAPDGQPLVSSRLLAPVPATGGMEPACLD